MGHIKPPPATNFSLNQFKAPPLSVVVVWAIKLYKEAIILLKSIECYLLKIKNSFQGK
jgi:hypothetical protein